MKEKVTIDGLIHYLEVFLRENPSWSDAEVMVVAGFLIVKRGSVVKTIDLEKEQSKK